MKKSVFEKTQNLVPKMTRVLRVRVRERPFKPEHAHSGRGGGGGLRATSKANNSKSGREKNGRSAKIFGPALLTSAAAAAARHVGRVM